MSRLAEGWNALKTRAQTLNTWLGNKDKNWIERPSIATKGLLETWSWSPVHTAPPTRRRITRAALVLFGVPLRMIVATLGVAGVFVLHAAWRVGSVALLGTTLAAGLVALPFLGLATAGAALVAKAQAGWQALKALFGYKTARDEKSWAPSTDPDIKQERLFAGSAMDIRYRVKAAAGNLEGLWSASPHTAQEKLWKSTVDTAALCGKIPGFGVQQIAETLGEVLSGAVDLVSAPVIWVMAVLGLPVQAAVEKYRDAKKDVDNAASDADNGAEIQALVGQNVSRIHRDTPDSPTLHDPH